MYTNNAIIPVRARRLQYRRPQLLRTSQTNNAIRSAYTWLGIEQRKLIFACLGRPILLLGRVIMHDCGVHAFVVAKHDHQPTRG